MPPMNDEDEFLKLGETVQTSSQPSNQRKYIVEEESCIICLQKITDKAILPQCSHGSQCFTCIVEWTKHSDKCPLCTTEIGPYIIHNLRSKHDYTRYFVSPPIKALFNGGIAATLRPTRRSNFSMDAMNRRWRGEARVQDELDQAILRRREIYQNSLYAKHVASNRFTRYVPHLNPNQMAASHDLQSRATAFLRRELRVWVNLDVEFLTNYIVTLMKSLDLRDESAIRLLADLLDPRIPYSEDSRKPNTEHLVHELLSYLRSPYKSIELYDKAVQYDSIDTVRMRPISTGYDPIDVPRDSSRGHPSRPHIPSPRPSKQKGTRLVESVGVQRSMISPQRSYYGGVEPTKSHNRRRPRSNSLEPRETWHDQDISARQPSPNLRKHARKQEEATRASIAPTLLDDEQPPGTCSASIMKDDIDNRGVLIEQIRRNINRRRVEESSASEGFPVVPGPQNVLDNPITTTNLSQSRREQLLARLEQEKTRVDSSITETDSRSNAASGGLQIKGAAAKAKEQALHEMERRLRMQALLRVKLAREKHRLELKAEQPGSIGTKGTEEAGSLSGFDLGERRPALHVVDPTAQQQLRERLLREKLLLGQRSTGAHRP